MYTLPFWQIAKPAIDEGSCVKYIQWKGNTWGQSIWCFRV
jgi:hypothetical protein